VAITINCDGGPPSNLSTRDYLLYLLFITCSVQALGARVRKTAMGTTLRDLLPPLDNTLTALPTKDQVECFCLYASAAMHKDTNSPPAPKGFPEV
jgi:hypothetical protein